MKSLSIPVLKVNLFQALDVLDVDRIGHGYHAIASEKLYKRIKERFIHKKILYIHTVY